MYRLIRKPKRQKGKELTEAPVIWLDSGASLCGGTTGANDLLEECQKMKMTATTSDNTASLGSYYMHRCQVCVDASINTTHCNAALSQVFLGRLPDGR